MQMPDLLGGAMLACAVAYALTGGADYGGGVWDLLARGPRAAQQRRLIEGAIGPIWEANHVWLIAVVVILFSAFPPAFSAVSIALHIPLTGMVLGIVARGAAFTFRAYDVRRDDVQRRWGLVFSIASTVTPVLLGVVVGSLASGGIEVEDGRVHSGFVAPWATSVFPWLVGLLTLTLFAHLAAVYLTVEAAGGSEADLAEDFRRRALASAGVAAVLAVGALAAAAWLAPVVYRGLLSSWWLFAATGVCAGGATYALVRRRYRLARPLAAAQVALVVVGWGVAQRPYLVVDDVTLAGASAPPGVQRAILIALAIGLPVVLACLAVLFRVFRSGQGTIRR